jgi:hypothetical protein
MKAFLRLVSGGSVSDAPAPGASPAASAAPASGGDDSDREARRRRYEPKRRKTDSVDFVFTQVCACMFCLDRMAEAALQRQTVLQTDPMDVSAPVSGSPAAAASIPIGGSFGHRERAYLVFVIFHGSRR